MKKTFGIGILILMVLFTACEKNSGILLLSGGVNVSSDTVSIGDDIEVSIGKSTVVTDNSWEESTSDGVTIHHGTSVGITMFSSSIMLDRGSYQDVDLVFDFILDDDADQVLGTLNTTLADVKEDIGVHVTVPNISEGKHKISVIGRSVNCPKFDVDVSGLKSKEIFVGASATLSGELTSDRLMIRNDDVMKLSIDHSRLLCRNANPQVEVTVEYLLDGKCIASSLPLSIMDEDLSFRASAWANNWDLGKHTLSIAAKTNVPQYSVDVSQIIPIEIEVVE